jgi:Cd2+/Zn2+-exporting ATPase
MSEIAQQNNNFQRRLELALTLITLCAILASLSAERLEMLRLSRFFDVISYLAGGWAGFRAAIPRLREGQLDINVLMILAAIGAALLDQWHEGAILLFLFSLSNTLQDYAMERSRRAIGSLLKLRPTEATLITPEGERRVPIEQIKIGDHVMVRPGEMLAVDGIIRYGESDLNEASITGESKPVDKGVGDTVFAGSMNGTGSLDVEVTRRPEDSTLAKIVHMVESAQSEKSRTQRLLDGIEGYYAWTVIVGSALLIVIPWAFFGYSFDYTFYRGMVLLVVASPCALIISTPASILSAIACGARHGVLFKGGVHLENMAEIRVIAFDKTGTLTHGELRLTDVVLGEQLTDGFTEDDLLAAAASLESRSEHPIAKAIVQGALERGLTLPPNSKFVNMPGRGAHAVVGGFLLWIGGERLFQEHGETIPDFLQREKARLEAEGKTVLLLHREISRSEGVGVHEAAGGWLGLVAVADTVREGVKEITAALKRHGIERTVILTGDNPAVAAKVAAECGVDEYHAGLLPDEKVALLHRLRKDYGPVMMVGDGVNDAPALAHASVGLAMGAAGSDVALESADAVLMGDDLHKIPFAIKLSHRAVRIVRYNLAFSLAVIALLVASVFLFNLKMPFGVIGHEGSTLIVAANGLRLLATRED